MLICVCVLGKLGLLSSSLQRETYERVLKVFPPLEGLKYACCLGEYNVIGKYSSYSTSKKEKKERKEKACN